MKVCSLDQFPEFYAQYIQCIAQAFLYDHKNSVEIDFYPLLNSANWKNCFFLQVGGELVATVAVKLRYIKLKSMHQVAFLGGIAVKSNHEKKGYFTKLFSEVIARFEDQVAWMGLWSEKLDLYRKFGFTPCFEQHFLKQGALQNNAMIINGNKVDQCFWQQVTLPLNAKQLAWWQRLYEINQQRYVMVERNANDWKEINQISSAHFWVYSNKQSSLATDPSNWLGYAIEGKGQDLPQVVTEWGFDAGWETSDASDASGAHELQKNAILDLNARFSIWGLMSVDLVEDKNLYAAGFNLLLNPACENKWSVWQQEFLVDPRVLPYSAQGGFVISGLDSV